MSRSSGERPVRVLCGLLLLWALVAPRGAHAEPDAFNTHFQRAQTEYQAGRYRASIRELEAAHALRPLPRLLLNIGNLQRKLGDADAAAATYRRYLQAEPEPPPDIRRDLSRYLARHPDAPPPVAPTDLTAPAGTQAPAGAQGLVGPRPLGASAALTGAPGPAAPSAPAVTRRWWFWTAIGVGAAAVIGGTVIALVPRPTATPQWPDVYRPVF